jgi:hypothetical protein
MARLNGWKYVLVPIVGFLILFAIRVPWQQQVRVVLQRGGKPVPQQVLKVVDRGVVDSCTGSSIGGTTDANGFLLGTRRRWWSVLDVLTTHIYSERVCILEADAHWKKLDVQPYGPAPSYVTLTCDLADESRPAQPCRVNVP